METSVLLIIVGLVIGFGAFIFAAYNMYRGVSGGSGFGGMFKGHLGAMAAMAFGGLLFVIGLVIKGVDVLNTLR